MKNIRLFENESAFIQARQNAYEEPWVSLTEYDNISRLNYNKTEDEKLLGTPLTFVIQSDGSVKWKTTYTGVTKTIEYKKNDGEWTTITSEIGNGAGISVVSGDTLQFRANNSEYRVSSSKYCYFSSSCYFEAKGNILSLVSATGFKDLNRIYAVFGNLFYGNTGLTRADKLKLPTTALTGYHCYECMFAGCTSLTTAPELPATTLIDYCYYGMFSQCTSLTSAPELPATTLNYMCYLGMFGGCTSLTTAPELPATTLASQCYQNMFYNCSSLNYIKCLATDISAVSCTSSWIDGVSNNGTFVKQSGTDWSVKTGVSGIPAGWTVVDA